MQRNNGSIFVSGQPSSIFRNRTRNPNRARLRIRTRNTERGHQLSRSDLNELDLRFFFLPSPVYIALDRSIHLTEPDLFTELEKCNRARYIFFLISEGGQPIYSLKIKSKRCSPSPRERSEEERPWERDCR